MAQSAVILPLKLTRQGELVVVLRHEYDEFLDWKRAFKSFKPTTADKRELKAARRDFLAGNSSDLDVLAS